jgi:putative effector of murein hydrolase LrgA (UPF0299 family)
MENKKINAQSIGGLIFAGCMFIGMGIGFYLNHLLPGIFIGMGVGFIGMGIAWGVFRNK